jgi:aminoglycoside 6'-N-acetyltransferase I
MQIIDLKLKKACWIEPAASLLFDAFRVNWPDAWPTLEDAREEIGDAFSEDRIALGALSETGTLLGWIGAIPTYEGKVWELHPLAVDPQTHGRGIGRHLVEGLEAEIALRGGQTLWLGTDDENNLTTVGGMDLYPNPLEHLTQIKNLGGHPFEFYRKLGFVITGVMPDANGFGKPDIYMAKRVGKKS